MGRNRLQQNPDNLWHVRRAISPEMEKAQFPDPDGLPGETFDIPVPPSPYTGYPLVDDADTNSALMRLRGLIPGVGNNVNKITRQPGPYLEDLNTQARMGNNFANSILSGRQSLDKSTLRGAYNPKMNDVYINPTDKEKQRVLAHELAHSRGFNEPGAELTDEMLSPYLNKKPKSPLANLSNMFTPESLSNRNSRLTF